MGMGMSFDDLPLLRTRLRANFLWCVILGALEHTTFSDVCLQVDREKWGITPEEGSGLEDGTS